MQRGAGAGRRPGGLSFAALVAALSCAGRFRLLPLLRLAPTMVLESVVADLLNRFLGDYVENLNKSQLKLGIWGGKREGAAASCWGLQKLAEGPQLRLLPSWFQPGPSSFCRLRLRLGGGRSVGPPPWAAGAGRGEACARLHRHRVLGARRGWRGSVGSRPPRGDSQLPCP